MLVELAPELARAEPDPEIQDLIRASVGLNLALDYLPGSLGFDPVAVRPEPDLASRILWFDALVTNVDRTPRNTNLLTWHGRLWLIDHGASLYFHHAWGDWRAASKRPFAAARDHVLLPFADAISEADATLPARLTEDALRGIVDLVPDEWLRDEAAFSDTAAAREAYVEFLSGGWRSRACGPGPWRRPEGMSVGEPFEYAVLRVVPRVERGECINAGVVLYCQGWKFLDARVHLDPDRLLALDPEADLDAVRAHLEAARSVCAGGPEAGAVGALPPRERFGWLVAPRSTVVQPSSVHTGLTTDPEAELERLFRSMVLPPGGPVPDDSR